MVKLAKKLFVLGMIAFWALVTNHCKLESIHGLEFLACSAPVDATPHQPFDCGENDACAAVEDGLYKTEESQVSAQKTATNPISPSFPLYSNFGPHRPLVRQISPDATPPELAQRWQFALRTALSPRAPSLQS